MTKGGFFGLYAGFSASLILSVNPALTYAIFDKAKKFASKRAEARAESQKDEKNGAAEGTETEAGLLFLAGVISKLVSLSLIYPLIRAKALMQTRQTGMVGVLLEVFRAEGFVGLYAGIGAQFSKSLLSTALLLVTKEKTTKLWRQQLAV